MRRLILFMLMVALCVYVYSDGAHPDGLGTEADPYQIETLDNLLWVSTTDSCWSSHFSQVADIDASDTENWNDGAGFSPIGCSEDMAFTGVYKGNLHSIMNLVIDRPDSTHQGLFGVAVEAIIDSLNLVDFTVRGDSCVGGMIGFCQDSYIESCTLAGEVTGNSSVGGLVGEMRYTSILYCTSEGEIAGDCRVGGMIGFAYGFNMQSSINYCWVSGNQSVGGLIGESYYNSGSTFYCNNEGNVTGNTLVGGVAGYSHVCMFGYIDNSGVVRGLEKVGGVVGFSNNDDMYLCSNHGEVLGEVETGGIFGNSTAGVVYYCNNHGRVIGTIDVGGISGVLTFETDCFYSYNLGSVEGENYIGGISGRNFFGSRIERCYNAGRVSGLGVTGGITAERENDCYTMKTFYDAQASGQSTSAGGNARTTCEMRNPATYQAFEWLFQSDSGSYRWKINPAVSNGYPFSKYYEEYEHQPPVRPLGDGTEDEPFLVGDLYELYWLSVNEGAWMSHIVQTDNIDLSEASIWLNDTGFSPIGNEHIRFGGSYDGNGYQLSNLTINRPESDYQGFFARLDHAVVENIRIVSASVTGRENVGILAGSSQYETIVRECMMDGAVEAQQNAGIMIGKVSSSVIEQCYIDGQVAASDYVGGFLGRVNEDSYVLDCYSQGSVIGKSNVGGFLGSVAGECAITRCYSIGEVSGEDQVGGFAGSADEMTISHSFWDIETSGQSEDAGATGLPSHEMMVQDTFIAAGWDFMGESVNGLDDVWGLNPNVNFGYPFLSWQGYLDAEDPGIALKVSSTSLRGNYPNPFNPSTTISFSVANGETGCLAIYNLKGQKVKDFSVFHSGEHDIVWNGLDDVGKSVASGVYLCRLQGEKQNLVRKIMLLK